MNRITTTRGVRPTSRGAATVSASAYRAAHRGTVLRADGDDKPDDDKTQEREATPPEYEGDGDS
ncbi:MAG: hypothetical protein ACRDQU_01600 [Pseudonocardiaceae bacterium]